MLRESRGQKHLLNLETSKEIETLKGCTPSTLGEEGVTLVEIDAGQTPLVDEGMDVGGERWMLRSLWCGKDERQLLKLIGFPNGRL